MDSEVRGILPLNFGMKRFTLGLTGLLLSLMMGAPVQALEVTVDNQTEAKVCLAFSYLSVKDKDWVVDGWYNVEPRQQAQINLDTDNDMYYLYTEFSNGKKIEGGPGAVKLRVQDEAFYCKQDRVPEEKSRVVSFLRARSNGDKANIKIK